MTALLDLHNKRFKIGTMAILIVDPNELTKNFHEICRITVSNGVEQN